MKLILLVFIQMWLVLTDAGPGGPPCDYDNRCPLGYKCEDDECVEVVPPTTTTTKKPTSPKPTLCCFFPGQCCSRGSDFRNCRKCIHPNVCYDVVGAEGETLTTCSYSPPQKPCCWYGNRFTDCYWCFYPTVCYLGKCRIPTPPTAPTTTPKPTTCKKDYDCPFGYKCDYEICVPVPTTTLKPTPPKPRQCCWSGNDFKNCRKCQHPWRCYSGKCAASPPHKECCKDGNSFTDCVSCTPPLTCIEGKCWTTITFARVNAIPTTTTPPPTTPTPCNEYKECPEGSKCEDDVCIQDY